MSEIPLEHVPGDVAAAAHDAARGKVVYLSGYGQRLAAIVAADLAAGLENLTPEAFRGLLEGFADVRAAREALAEIKEGAVRSRLSRSGRSWAWTRDLPAARASGFALPVSRAMWVAAAPGAVAALALNETWRELNGSMPRYRLPDHHPARRAPR